MKLEQIINIMEKIAPPILKEDYDNVGLMVGDKTSDIKKVLIALDCTLDVIEEAKEHNVDLIITHHPLIFRKPSTITTDTLMGKKIIKLIKNNINLYSSHTNFDSVKEGLNDKIVELLGFSAKSILEPTKVKGFDESGIGRFVELEEVITLDELIDKVKISLNISNLRYVPSGNDRIKKIAIINGSGQDFFSIAYNNGADCVITGDTTYHYASDYKEMGLNILDIGHFGSEWPVFMELSKKIIKDIKSVEGVEILISKKSEDPYRFI
ncbi:Nif3-like dinuclear metal center hexameric protein [Clostridium intestinale]|uniref:GTP cyclohydrolase 1 type 2 homolog n=1 Tax=Clostridium intestinale URNW TaxID=1294142 RepID=U2NRZ5_9CLOT|nr:Nif3-like dinuclear metal center hexameric protein [Clostridium intestinale]ERK31621.1 hypothetical protein CINTURNW_0999 [Clostridium intestinale URNW]